jgi:hypothetical protein
MGALNFRAAYGHRGSADVARLSAETPDEAYCRLRELFGKQLACAAAVEEPAACLEFAERRIERVPIRGICGFLLRSRLPRRRRCTKERR